MNEKPKLEEILKRIAEHVSPELIITAEQNVTLTKDQEDTLKKLAAYGDQMRSLRKQYIQRIEFIAEDYENYRPCCKNALGEYLAMYEVNDADLFIGLCDLRDEINRIKSGKNPEKDQEQWVSLIKEKQSEYQEFEKDFSGNIFEKKPKSIFGKISNIFHKHKHVAPFD